jgi:hypothetical protein
VARAAAEVRAAAGDRDVELSMNLFGAGAELSPFVERHLGVDAATLRARDSLVLLPGADARAMADELLRRRDAFGVSYVTVNAAGADALAPVVELLAGR